MTDLQRTEFEILKVFVAICEKLDLRYFLVCGSALGAVKYGGFIPWDDDVDVGLFREDYERFLKEAPALLPPHLFLQHYTTDPSFPHVFAKIRNSNTTYIEKTMAHLPMNHGIYIDVFPLDGYPTDEREIRRLQAIKRSSMRKILCVYRSKKSLKGQLWTLAMRALGVHRRTGKILRRMDAALSAYPTADSPLICNHGNWQGSLEYAPREQYGNGATVEFEGLEVRVPEQYDAYLTQKYRDWRADLPEEQKVGHHYYELMDTGKPYTAYR